MKEIITNDEIIEQEAEKATEKPYKFRTLSAQDVFPMFNIISKIGIKEFKSFFEGEGLEKIMTMFSGQRDEGSVEALGVSIAFEIADVIFSNLPKCENDIFKLLAQTSNLEFEDVKKLSLSDFAEMVIDFVKKEEFKDFIKVVSKLFK